jgi:hypothetical protein
VPDLWLQNEGKWYTSTSNLYLFDKVGEDSARVSDLTCGAGGWKVAAVVACAASSLFAGAAVWNEKSEYGCCLCSTLTPCSAELAGGASGLQLNCCDPNAPVVGDGKIWKRARTR